MRARIVARGVVEADSAALHAPSGDVCGREHEHNGEAHHDEEGDERSARPQVQQLVEAVIPVRDDAKNGDEHGAGRDEHRAEEHGRREALAEENVGEHAVPQQ